MTHNVVSPERMKNIAVFALVVFSLVTGCNNAVSMQYVYEPERERTSGRLLHDGLITTLPNGAKTIYLDVDQRITYQFTIESSCLISVANVVYANDIGSDRVDVILGGMEVGTFTTRPPTHPTPPGDLWNVLHDSRAVGASVLLQPTFQSVTLTVNHTECRGVEIGNITLNFVCDQDPNVAGGTPVVSDGLSAGAIVGIVFGIVGLPSAIAAIGSIVGWNCWRLWRLKS